MNNLNTLLEDASADVPHDAFEVDGVISVGRSRVRRRRTVAGLAVAAVVGLGAVLVVPGGGSGDDDEPATPPQVRVLTLDDAVAAEPGRDYQVLGEFTAHSTGEKMTGDFVRAVLPDGTAVLQRYPHGLDAASEIALVGTGGTQAVAAPRSLANFLGTTDRELAFGDDVDGLWLLDRTTLQWRQVGRSLDLNEPVQPLTSQNGHLFIGGAPTSEAPTRPIYDVDLGAGTSAVVARGGYVAANDGRVAWTSGYDVPVGTVTVRDLRGGTSEFDPHTGDCLAKGIGLTAQRIVVMTNCDGAADDEYNDIVTRVDVFDLDGHPLARISGADDMGPVRMSDRFLTLSTWSGEREGTYTYDLATERFLRVTDEMSGLAGNETGSGPTVVWEKRLDGETGATYVVAQMR